MGDLWGCLQEVQHPTIYPLTADRLVAMESKGMRSGVKAGIGVEP
jgi:hypothetical protein